MKEITKKGIINPITLLILMSIAMPVAFNVWSAMLNNFVVEKAAFTGVEIGIYKALGRFQGFYLLQLFLSFLLLENRYLQFLPWLCWDWGVSMTGFFPSAYGLYFTTIVMSTGFHYFEAVKQSLSLQWLSKEEAPKILGKLIAVGSLTSLLIYGSLWILLEVFEIPYFINFVIAGGICIVLAFVMFIGFPVFPSKVPQNKNLVLRKRYWLFYVLTFYLVPEDKYLWFLQLF